MFLGRVFKAAVSRQRESLADATAVQFTRQTKGIAGALKRSLLYWGATNGVVELITWTQKGNEAMQALNASLGYENRSRVLTMQGPLPG